MPRQTGNWGGRAKVSSVRVVCGEEALAGSATLPSAVFALTGTLPVI